MRLFEKHRPRSFDCVVGQDKAIARLASVRSAGGLGGQSYFIQGPSGCGKTTIARLIAAEIAGPLATDEVNAADIDLEYIRTMERQFATRALSRPGEPSGRAWIFNEAHLMRKPVISRLLTTLEAVPDHCVIIFTTTNDNADAMFEDYNDSHPLLSRCVELSLNRNVCAAFAVHAKRIAEQEGLDGRPVAQYERFLKDHGNNLRALFQHIESGAMKA
jgi:replication-associated recombination protein RarA